MTPNGMPAPGRASGRLAPRAPIARRRPRLVLRTRRPALSLCLDRRVLFAVAVSSALVAGAVAVTLLVGRYPVAPANVWAALLGHASEGDQLVITELRLPRVMLAVLVGAALGMSGAIFQGMAQNPLVTPDVIGINQGAALAAVVAVVIQGEPQPPAAFGFAGALAVAAAVYVLSRGPGLSRFRLVLIGIGINAALAAAVTYLLTIASLTQLEVLNRWLLGDLSGATPAHAQTLALPVLTLIAAGLLLGRQLEMLQLGESVASGLGARVSRARVALLVVGAGLAAVAVTAAGPIGFVAFIAPQVARWFVGRAGAGVLPVAATAGAALLVTADYAAQRLLEPTQLPVGILTVAIGGPYFLLLLARASRSGLVA